jgi:N-acetylmuramoyl-L-alanine amidase
MTVSLRIGLDFVAAWRFWRPVTFKRRRRGITVAPVLKFAPLRVVAATSTAVLLAASSLAAPVTQAAPGSVAGMIVFLDPGHNGANDASMTRQVPTGRGGTKDCQASGTNTASGYAEHTFNWDTVLRIRATLNQLGVRTAMSRGNDDAVGPCVDERAAMANSLKPNAVVSIHADGGPPTGRGFHILYSSPPLNAAQAGPSVQFARMMRDQIAASGIPPSTYIGADGLNPRADIAGLNLAQYPSILVEMGNMKNPVDSTLMESEDGRQKYADAVANGVVAFLQTQPARTS